MVIVYLGTEKYLIDKYMSFDTDGIELPDFNLKTFHKYDSSIMSTATSMPMMADKRVTILKVAELDTLPEDFIEFLIENSGNSAFDVIVVADKHNKAKKAYKSLNSAKLIKECSHLEDKEKVSRVILSEIKNHGAAITPDALDLFIQRTGYLEDKDMNLYMLVNILYNVIDYDEKITANNVEWLVDENIVGNIFSLGKLLVKKDMPALFKQIKEVSPKNSIGVVSALLREFRVAYKLKNYKDTGLKYSSLGSLSNEQLVKGIEICTRSISSVKVGYLTDEELLKSVITDLYAIM